MHAFTPVFVFPASNSTFYSVCLFIVNVHAQPAIIDGQILTYNLRGYGNQGVKAQLGTLDLLQKSNYNYQKLEKQVITLYFQKKK